MAALQRKLVHKQFNSPMGLYSQENVKATLNRELKAFGGEGIEVDDQISKPLNLANSAVLRAVEEEEQQAKSGYKRVAWPPASEERIIREFTPQPQTQSPAPGAGGYYPQAHAPSPAAAPPQQQQQYGAPSYDGQQQQQPATPWQQQQQQPQQPAAPWQQQQQHQQVPQQQYQPQSQAQAPYQPPQWNQQQQQPSYQTSPYQQQPQQQQQQQQQPSYYPQQNGGSTFAQTPYNSYSQPQLPYSQDQTDLLQQQQQQQQQHPGSFAGQDNSYRGASPGIITLRKEAPVSQQPAPVYTSQPAAVSYQGGSKLRGDLKWPPPEYKEAAARENEERRQLALGPVCRPRRVNRDYTPFFAKHQLNNGYPSYKVPPGTQHIFG
ncbi:mediator of RNA polymerase II transcription subunit 15 isoform X5 [Drosophila elegans]|uniref:mediator of RNA polymerase II transcription subunit 15 isoform X5 n=1 Tax=Drosophila elegans TaxID=30023 RepID=UPI0007E6BC12|nr:mediator of RNA polymerase II transcription subunit 15 isoform X5 [Drosophila elegans]